MPTYTFTYTIDAWEETHLSTNSGHKLTHVHYVRHFGGDLVGTGVNESTCCYLPASDGQSCYVSSGVIVFEGTINGEKGTAVFVIHGLHAAAGKIKSEWVLDQTNCTGAFEGLKGKGGDIMDTDPKEGWLELVRV